MPYDMPLLMRFLAKLVLDILPAALASVIGGFLFTHYQLGHAVVPAPSTEQHAAASAEMMKLVRDEHALIVDFLNAQMAAEKARLAAEDRAAAHPAGDVRPMAAALASHRPTVAMVAAKPVTLREPPAAAVAATPTATLHAPVVIAQAQPNESAAPAAPAAPAEQPAARGEDSLIAKTIKIKDQVVTVTQRAAAAIGGIPSWIAAVGDRIGGQSTNSSSAGHLVSASW